MNTRRIVAEWLQDSTIGFFLLVGGISLADVIDRLLFGGISLLAYTLCMCMGLVPFFWFAKRKGAIAYDALDVVAWLIFCIAAALVLSYQPAPDWLPEHEYYGAFLFPISVLGSIWLYRGIRRFLTSRLRRAR